jgi:hypothetical protein
LKHRRCNETKKYHPAQQSPHENDWLPGNENPHGRTSGDEEWLTITDIILRNPQTHFEKIVLVMTVEAVSDKDFEDCCVALSEHANRKSHPFQASLAQADEIRTRRDASQIEAGSQYHNVIFEFGRGTRAEEFSATRIEQRYIVRPLLASDWQLQLQSLCVSRNL